MSQITFPSDQELFQGLRPDGSPEPGHSPTLAAVYEDEMTAYLSKNLPDSVHASAYSAHEARESIHRQEVQVLIDLWARLDEAIENHTKSHSIGRFPEAEYKAFTAKDKSGNKSTYSMRYFVQLGNGVSRLRDGSCPGPLGLYMNRAAQKFLQLKADKARRNKLAFGFILALVQLAAALIVIFTGFTFQTGTGSPLQILQSAGLTFFLLLGLIYPAAARLHPKGTLPRLVLHPLALIVLVFMGWATLAGLPIQEIWLLWICRGGFLLFQLIQCLAALRSLTKARPDPQVFAKAFGPHIQETYRYIRLRQLWWQSLDQPGAPPSSLTKLQKMFQTFLRLYQKIK